MEALKKCEKELGRAAAIQLCYEGKIINKMDRYILLGQYVDQCEKVIAVKAFEKGRPVTDEFVFTAITEHVDQNIIDKVYSVVSDTTALYSGKMSGVNKRLADFYKLHHDRNIYSLECLFHVNEIYFTRGIAKIEDKNKGPGAMEDGSLMKYFGDIRKPDMSKLIDREKIVVSVNKMASLRLRKRLSGSPMKKSKQNDHSFRNDHMCLLALSCYNLMEVSENVKPLLAYQQETTCHPRRITATSAYLRLLIFDIYSYHLDDHQKSKLIWLISYIISIYVPSFFPIHLKPSAAEGPIIILFQRDHFLAYREIDSEQADVVLKYFYEHAAQWMSPVNVALSVFAEVSPYSIEAVKTSHYPDSVDAQKLLQGRKAGLRDFFTSETRTALCIVCCAIPVAHWKSIKNNSRATERLIDKFKIQFLILFHIQIKPTCIFVRFYVIWSRC